MSDISSQVNSGFLKSGNSLILIDQSTKEQKSFFHRAFSPVQVGALRNSISTLLAASIGIAIFNLPYRVSQIGILLYIFLMGLATFFSYLGMYLISRIIVKFKVVSFNDMAQKSYGNKFKYLSQMTYLLYLWGTISLYLNLSGKFVAQILHDTFGEALFNQKLGRVYQMYNQQGQNYQLFIIIGITVGIFFLFVLIKQLKFLKKITIIGVFAIIINITIIILTFLVGFQENVDGKKIQFYGFTDIKWNQINWVSNNGWDSLSQFMRALSSIIFCFVNHHLIFPIVYQLKNPTKKRLDKIFNRVHGAEISIYIIIGLFGYILLLQYIQIFPINSIVVTSIITSSSSIGKAFMILGIVISIPCLILPTRQTIIQLFNIENNHQNHVLASIGILLSASIVSIFLKNVNIYFTILGGIFGVVIIGIIPSLSFYKIKGLRSWKQQLIILYMFTISALGIFGAIFQAIDI